MMCEDCQDRHNEKQCYGSADGFGFKNCFKPMTENTEQKIKACGELMVLRCGVGNYLCYNCRPTQDRLEAENTELRELIGELLDGGQFCTIAIEQYDPNLDFEEWEIKAQSALEKSNEEN